MPDAPDGANDPGGWSEPLFASLRREPASEVDIVPAELGEDYAFLHQATEKWLANFPRGPLAIDSAAGAQKIAALAVAHQSGFLSGASELPPRRALVAGIAAELPDEDGGSRYELTDWGRRGIGLILAAVRALRRHTDNPAVTAEEFSGLLLATLPLLDLPKGAEGILEFTIDPDPNGLA